MHKCSRGESLAAFLRQYDEAVMYGHYDDMKSVAIRTESSGLDEKVANRAEELGYSYYGKVIDPEHDEVCHLVSLLDEEEFELDAFYDWYIG